MSATTDTTKHENGCRAEDGQPQGLPLRQVCRGVFSEESLMSVVTDTTNHKNEVGVVVLGWQTTRAWIPAYAGMTVGVVGRLFSEE